MQRELYKVELRSCLKSSQKVTIWTDAQEYSTTDSGRFTTKAQRTQRAEWSEKAEAELEWSEKAEAELSSYSSER